LVEQLPAAARRHIEEYETSIKYWLDRKWMRAGIRKSVASRLVGRTIR
jgi:hypothetical protein